MLGKLLKKLIGGKKEARKPAPKTSSGRPKSSPKKRGAAKKKPAKKP